MRDPIAVYPSSTGHSFECRGSKFTHSHLDIKHVFGYQVGNRRGADVVNAQGQISQRLSKIAGDLFEFRWPGGLIWLNHNHSGILRFVSTLRQIYLFDLFNYLFDNRNY